MVQACEKITSEMIRNFQERVEERFYCCIEINESQCKYFNTSNLVVAGNLSHNNLNNCYYKPYIMESFRSKTTLVEILFSSYFVPVSEDN